MLCSGLQSPRATTATVETGNASKMMITGEATNADAQMTGVVVVMASSQGRKGATPTTAGSHISIEPRPIGQCTN